MRRRPARPTQGLPAIDCRRDRLLKVMRVLGDLGATLTALGVDAAFPALIALNNAHAEELTFLSPDGLTRLIRSAFVALCARG